MDSSASGSADMLNPKPKPNPKPKNRCSFDTCRHKLLLSDFPCKCAKTFCSSHRHSEHHNCEFDYKQNQKDILLRTMSSSVVAKKVDII
jgi:hypothetical protein